MPNPPLFESKLEKNMQTLLVLEDAHRQLRQAAVLFKFMIIFGLVSHYSEEERQRKLIICFRNSAYLPKLTPKSTIDDFAFTPSKLGEKFNVGKQSRFQYR